MSGSSARESDTFADQLAAGLAGYGPRPFIEFERTWYTGNDIAVLISAIEDTLRRGGVLPGEPVALVVRNRIAHAAAVLGFIATQRPVSMIYSYQSETAIAADIRDVRPAALLADPVDLGVRVLDAVREVGGVAVELNPQGPVPRSGPRTSPGPSEHSPSGFGISMLTSGTTGPPKRISIPTAVLAHTVSSMTLGQSRSSDDPPTLAFWPFGSVGVCQLLAGAFAGQRIVLMNGSGRSRSIASSGPVWHPLWCACCWPPTSPRRIWPRCPTCPAVADRSNPGCSTSSNAPMESLCSGATGQPNSPERCAVGPPSCANGSVTASPVP
jgi:acyl-CoA synthetase (AMP-forming)/AMP-acid ligase II